MERDVVLGHEIIVLRVIVLPPFLPEILVTLVLGPMDRGGIVAHHGLEPDVYPLVLVTVPRDLDTPVQISSHRPVDQAFLQPVTCEVDHGRPPVLLALGQPFQQCVPEIGQFEEKVFRLPEFQFGFRVELGMRIYQFIGIQGLTAVVALIATG